MTKPSYEAMIIQPDTALIAADPDLPNEAFKPALFESEPEVNPHDLPIGYLRIGQGLTQEVADNEAQIGDFLFPGEAPIAGAEGVLLIPAALATTRLLMNRDTNEIECQSHDGKVGVGTPGGACSDCALKDFREVTLKNGTVQKLKPSCVLSKTVLAWSPTYNQPLRFSFRGTAERAISPILQTYTIRKGWGFAVRLKSRIAKGEKGSYAVPTVTIARDIPDAEITDAIGAAMEFLR